MLGNICIIFIHVVLQWQNRSAPHILHVHVLVPAVGIGNLITMVASIITASLVAASHTSPARLLPAPSFICSWLRRYPSWPPLTASSA